MAVDRLLSRLKENKVKLWVNENKLNYITLENASDSDLKKDIMENQEELLDFFHRHRSVDKSDSSACYWNEKISSYSKLLRLPFDYNRSLEPIRKYELSTFNVDIDKNNISRLNKDGVTDESILLAVTQLLLYRYTNEGDFLTGCLFSNDNDPGCFSRVSVLHSSISPGFSFRQFIDRLLCDVDMMKGKCDVALEDTLRSILPHDETANFNPVYQVMFSFIEVEYETEVNLEINPSDSCEGNRKVDLHISFLKSGNGIKGHIWYSCSLFKPETIRRMSLHFKELLSGALAAPDSEITLLPILSAEEKQVIDTSWDGGSFSDTRPLTELFEECAEKRPEDTAVIDMQGTLNYRELNSNVNQLADMLIKEGVGPDVRVGVFIDRSSYAVVSLISVLKAGGFLFRLISLVLSRI